MAHRDAPQMAVAPEKQPDAATSIAPASADTVTAAPASTPLSATAAVSVITDATTAAPSSVNIAPTPENERHVRFAPDDKLAMTKEFEIQSSSSSSSSSIASKQAALDAEILAIDEYKKAFAALEALRDKREHPELEVHINKLLQQVELLLPTEPIAKLTEALDSTYKRLTHAKDKDGKICMDSNAYNEVANKMRGHPSTGLKVLGGLMLALGIAVAILGIVFAPVLVGAAAIIMPVTAALAVTGVSVGVSSVGTLAAGLGIFGMGTRKGLSAAMHDVDQRMNEHPNEHYAAAPSA